MAELVKPTFREALLFWIKLGFISFGGPAGQISIMHTEVVEKKRWVAEDKFLHALNYCMLLPGPEAQQLATYLGWRLHGLRGGIAAGTFFILPAAILLWALSWVYMVYGEVRWVSAIFQGLQPAVLAIVASAVLRVGRKALKNNVLWVVAAGSFTALFFFKAPFVGVIVTAGLIGWLGSKLMPHWFAKQNVPDASSPENSNVRKTSLWKTAGTFMGCLLAWWLPLLGLGLWLGWKSMLFQEAVFFSKAALITFGGAYAVLPYIAQQAVEHYGWLSAPQMMSGLALAETTPGPLIMVLQFVGFVGAWQHPGNFSPIVAATFGAFVSTWATFLPSFLFILTGAPFVERLENVKALNAILSGVTAAVVGVILNLALWFGLHTILLPTGIDWVSLAMTVVLFLAMLRWNFNILLVIGAGALFGLARVTFGF